MDKKVTLFSLFMPIYMTMLLNLATVLINTYMISLVNPYLVGAMAAGNQIFILFVNIFNLLAVGCSVVVSQALGASNKKIAIRAIHASISFNFVIGLVSGILVFIFASNILHLMKIPEQVFEESHIYLRIICLIFFVDGMAIVLSAVTRAYGYANYALVLSLVMNIITILGNIISLFEVFGLPFYGLMGVGISTITGRIIGVTLYFIILIKVIKIPIFMSLFIKIKGYILKKILKIGLPSAGENMLWSLQFIVAFSFIASMGEDTLTVQTIYFQISSFVFFASMALGMSNQVIVARFVGSDKNDDAYSHTYKTLKIGHFINIVLLSLVFVMQDFIMDLLNLNENMKTIMKPLFYVSFFLELCRTLNIVMTNALKASGDAKYPFFVSAISIWLISLPIGYFLGISLDYGIVGIWIGFLVDEFTKGTLNAIRWKSKKWIGKKLV